MPTLHFKGKPLVQNHHLVVPYSELEPVKSRGLSKTPSLHDNLIIEGDNLRALKALLPTYHGKVKCIYIDPPYNTGNEGWIYNDRVNSPMIRDWFNKTVDRDDLTRHDKWCCMMLPRLKLLRELLTDDGAIFVSIDDNEVHHLRALMDEVFGEENFAALFAVVNNLKGRNDKANVATTHEYLVVYSRSSAFKANGLPLSEEQKAKFKYVDKRGNKYDLRDLRKRGRPDRREDRPNMWFPIFYNEKEQSFSLERRSKADIEITPKRGDGSDGRWRWGKKRVSENLGLLHASYTRKSEKWDIAHRVYIHQVSTTPILGDDDLDEDEETPEERTSKAKSIIMGGEFSTDVARRTVKTVLEKDVFEYPKPVDLLRRILQYGANNNSIILDSFAGSGTTAHAVLALNKEDGGNRRFILCQMPYETKEQEKKKENIAERITAERVRRVIKGVPTAKDENLRNGLGGTFSYFKLGRELEKQAILDGKDLPSYEALAGYVFWTATGEEFQAKKMKRKQWFIGESREYAVFLIYDNDIEKLKDMALTLDVARSLPDAGKKPKLVFAPTEYLGDRFLVDLRIKFCQLPFEIYEAAEAK
ncbi:site-specific DNA-methyltransferase [soil metagenome]